MAAPAGSDQLARRGDGVVAEGYRRRVCDHKKRVTATATLHRRDAALLNARAALAVRQMPASSNGAPTYEYGGAISRVSGKSQWSASIAASANNR